MESANLSSLTNLTNLTSSSSNETDEANPTGKDHLFEFVTEGVLLVAVNILSLFSSSLSPHQNKLECFQLTSLPAPSRCLSTSKVPYSGRRQPYLQITDFVRFARDKLFSL